MEATSVFYELDSFYRKLARYLEETDQVLDQGRWFELAEISPIRELPEADYDRVVARVARETDRFPELEEVRSELIKDFLAVQELVSKYYDHKLGQNAPPPQKEDWLQQASALRYRLVRQASDFARRIPV